MINKQLGRHATNMGIWSQCSHERRKVRSDLSWNFAFFCNTSHCLLSIFSAEYEFGSFPDGARNANCLYYEVIFSYRLTDICRDPWMSSYYVMYTCRSARSDWVWHDCGIAAISDSIHKHLKTWAQTWDYLRENGTSFM